MQTWAGAGIIGLKRTNRGQRTLRDSRGKRDADGARANIAANLGTICALSRAKTGHGFGQFRPVQGEDAGAPHPAATQRRRRALAAPALGECGGPPVSKPGRHGFGHSLINEGPSYELDGALAR